MNRDDARRTTDAAEVALGNLPAQLTRLVGRDAALTQLGSAVWRTRVLTLWGPGGVGKTRLAAALAELVQADFVDGAWWADLADTSDPELVGQEIAAAVLPGEVANGSAVSAIARRFSESSLLVLDNCEQVVDGCARIVLELLARTQSLRVIATSRQPLGVPGEHVWRVPGLFVPDHPRANISGDDGAVGLFIERARQAVSTFDPSAPGVLDAVTRICALLDGMPLAIELAVARVPVLGVGQIADRLERDAGFLRHASRAAPARHRTLQETLDWSHRLLEDAEQTLFRRLGSFRGGFSLAAAEAICADDALPLDDVLDLLGVLVDRSLVQFVEDVIEPRYKLLATVRQYAAAKLDRAGDSDAVRDRHARYFHGLAQSAQADLAGVQQVRWLQQFELEHDNLSEALARLIERSPNDAAELVSLLWPFWYQHGYYSEARTWFEAALAVAVGLDTNAVADLELRAGEVAFLQCDYELAIAYLQRALERSEEVNDRDTAAAALQRLGSIAREQGRYSDARRLHERSCAVWDELGDRRGAAASHNYLGFVAWLAGEPDEAESLCGSALLEFRASGHLEDAAGTLVNLGAAAMYGGSIEVAVERLEEALAISRRLGFQEGIAWSLHELAIASRRQRRPLREQASMLRDALLIHHQLGDRWRIASVLEEIAGSLLSRQDRSRAVEMLAYTETLRLGLGTPVPPAESPDRDAALRRLESKLGLAAFTTAWTDGRSWDLERAVDEAVRVLEFDQPGSPSPSGVPAPILTSREVAVLELLSQGATNREIAAALYISPSTAGVHVSNILRKLGAKRRIDATSLAHTLGLLPVS